MNYMSEDIQTIIKEMREEAWLLMESSKTPNGKSSYTATASDRRNLSYKLTLWANALEGKN
jgi:hypothetical protein